MAQIELSLALHMTPTTADLQPLIP